jgi:hypothetical protein
MAAGFEAGGGTGTSDELASGFALGVSPETGDSGFGLGVSPETGDSGFALGVSPETGDSGFGLETAFER